MPLIGFFNKLDKNILLGIILVLLGTLFGTIGQVFLKIGSANIDPIHAVFWRSIAGFIIFFIIVFRKFNISSLNIAIIKQKYNLKWYILRGFVSTFAAYALFTAISQADMSEIGSLANINPIFTALIAFFILKEELSIKTFFTILIGIVGVFMIRNPFISNFSQAHLLVFLAALLIGFDFVLMKKLSLLNFHYILIVGVMLIFGFFITLPKVIIEFRSYTPYIFILIFLAGTFDLITQIFYTNAAKYLTSGSISIISLISVFEFMLWGNIIFQESVTIINIIGGILIIISSGSIIYLRNRGNKATKKVVE
jgi:drug/metabolite transporter (DMT)-like permease